MRWQRAARWLWFFMGFALASAHAAHEPSEVAFASLDGKTALKGYLFQPATPGPWPAVVMMHGRAGPYSAAAKGVYDATTLSLRHKQWGRFWAERGYLALLAARLKLEDALVAHLHASVEGATEPAAQQA